MTRVGRDTLRIVAPPLLALGLVALLVHPVDAASAPTAPVQGTAITTTR